MENRPIALSGGRRGGSAAGTEALGGAEISAASVRDQIVDAVRSLMSFLVAVKQLEPPEAARQLEHCSVLVESAPRGAGRFAQ